MFLSPILGEKNSDTDNSMKFVADSIIYYLYFSLTHTYLCI